MALHDPNEVRVWRRLKLVFRDFLDAIDQASTWGTVEERLSVGRTELEVRDDVGLTDPHGEPLRARRGENGLAMTGNGRRTLRHRDLQHKTKLNPCGSNNL